MKVYKLRTWVKVVIALLIGAIIGIAIYQLFTVETIDKRTGATCNGGIVKVCSGTLSQYKETMDR